MPVWQVLPTSGTVKARSLVKSPPPATGKDEARRTLSTVPALEQGFSTIPTRKKPAGAGSERL
jgi:hypothetical protein